MQDSKTVRLRKISLLNHRFVACPGCDALWDRPSVPHGHRVCCPRCNSVIVKSKAQRPQRSLAMLASSVVLFALVGLFPFLKMEASGLSNQISLVEAVAVLWRSDFRLLATACALLVLILPLARVVLSSLVAACVLRQRPLSLRVRKLAAFNQSIAPWAMAEIFMLGVVVSMVKVGMLANIELGGAFWALAAFLIAMGAGFSAICSDTLWAESRESL